MCLKSELINEQTRNEWAGIFFENSSRMEIVLKEPQNKRGGMANSLNLISKQAENLRV